MLLTSHVFGLNKRTMLNVLYDTIDALGLELIQANSRKGILIVLVSDNTPDNIRIAIEITDDSGNTQVQLFSDAYHPTAEAWVRVFFEEVNAIIKKSLLEEQG